MTETTRTGSRSARTDTDASRDQKTPDSADNPASRVGDREDSPPVAQDSISSGEESRIMTDGGRDYVDPTNLPSSYSPAYVRLIEDGEIFVARCDILDSGWISVTHWDRERVKFPPHRVQMIQHVRTERHGERDADGLRPERLAVDSQRQEARRLAGIDDDSVEEAVADD